jgi:hypothetical protein
MEPWSPKIGCDEKFWFDLNSPDGDTRKVCSRYGYDPARNSYLCRPHLCPRQPNSLNWPGSLTRADSHLEHGKQVLKHYNSGIQEYLNEGIF